MKIKLILVFFACATLLGCPAQHGPRAASEDIANEWMTLLREASVHAGGMPTVEARFFYHFALAMYEAWAAYDNVATGVLAGVQLRQPVAERTLANRAEAISHAVYEVAKVKFEELRLQPDGTPAHEAFDLLTLKMIEHGYIDGFGVPVISEAQLLGKQVADLVTAYGLDDGANEPNRYSETVGYLTVNPPLFVADEGTNGVLDPNRWQTLTLPGHPTQGYLTPHWGLVQTFAFGEYSDTLRFDPGPPPAVGTAAEPAYIRDMVDLIQLANTLDPHAGPGAEFINLSPGADDVANLADSPVGGHANNPYTGQPYVDYFVRKGNYLRALAMHLDGNTHNTPPPWWVEVAVDCVRGEGLFSQIPENKPGRYNLEYDVKLFFAVTAAVHDAAIGVWDVKLAYDYCRPITGIRYLAEAGKLPFIPGLIEPIGAADPLAGEQGEHVGEYKIQCWAGPNLGMQWMLATKWRPYQADEFMCPPFPGYPSGHTAMARAAAEVFTAITGDEFVPGGLMQWTVSELPFEDDMIAPVTLQAATWRCLADQAAFGRLCSGVHTRADIVGAKPLGKLAGERALALAQEYFEGHGVGVMN